MQTRRNSVYATAGLIALWGLMSGSAFAQSPVYTNNPAAPYDAQCYLMAHNSYANPSEGYDSLWYNQDGSLWQQMMDGVRCINLDVWQVKQKKVALTYHLKVWDHGSGTWKTPKITPPDPVSIDWDNVDSEIVTAHEPMQWGYSTLRGLGSDYFVGSVWDPTTWGDYKESKFQSLVTDLRTVEGFVSQVTGEVVTLRLESYVTDTAALQQCFDDAGLTQHVFWADRDNPGCWVDKPGCPASERVAWNVSKHGWPSVYQLCMWRKNCVVLTDYSRDGMPYEKDLLVKSPEPGNCFSPVKVFQPDSNSGPMNDLTRSLFSMTWHVEQPMDDGANLGDVNSFLQIGAFWQNVLWQNSGCGRIPNFLEVDFYQRGAYGGPRKAQQVFNQVWASLPAPHCYAWTPTPANANGWNNTTTTCGIIGYGGATICHISADAVNGNAKSISPQYMDLSYSQGTGYSDPSLLTFTQEGTTRVAFFVRSANNMQSSLQFVVVRVDKTAPKTTATAQGRTIVLTAADALSGVDKIYYSVDGGPEKIYAAPLPFNDTVAHTLTYRSKDKADNYEVSHVLSLPAN